MSTYIVRRLLGAVAVLFGLVFVAFMATHYIGDPVSFLVDPEYTPPEEIERIREAGGYNRPVWEQFTAFLGGAIRGDFGDSVYQNRPSRDVVMERIPRTLQLGAAAFLLTFLIAIPLAVFSARRHGKVSNHVVTGVTTFLASVPGFFLALVFIALFAVQLRWVPTSGYGWWPEMVLPVIALSLGTIGRYTQVLEQAIRSEFASQYVRTARAKGLSESVVSRRHVLRNAGLVGLTLVGTEMILLFNGAVIIEQIFAWPGVGKVLLDSVSRRDLPVVMAGVVYIGIIVVLVNLAVDLLYAYADPRVRLS